MQSIVMASSVAAASAFVAPNALLSKVVAPKAGLSMQFEEELGATPPLGYFDPFGLSVDGNEATFRRYREIEIKHGRTAMLATVGTLVQEFVRLPGYLSTSSNLKFADVPNGLAALKVVPALGIAQILIFQALIEIYVWKQDPELAPGDVGGEGWKRYEDPEVKADKLNKELNNGRLAQMAIAGMWAQMAVTGQGPLQQIIEGHISPFGDGQGYF